MSVSLNGALRTCKVDVAWDARMQSDRFENPDIMSCPVWSGRDLTGRLVCENSFMTKTAGCDSASDRILVENAVSRPSYMSYVQLDGSGIDLTSNSHVADSKIGYAGLNNIANDMPTWTTVNRGTVYAPCQNGSTTAYQFAMQQNANLARGAANIQTQNISQQQNAGMR